jgi:hypothetical protein
MVWPGVIEIGGIRAQYAPAVQTGARPRPRYRAIATRDDTTQRNVLAAVQLAASAILLT